MVVDQVGGMGGIVNIDGSETVTGRTEKDRQTKRKQDQ